MNVDSKEHKPQQTPHHRRKHERKDFAFGISIGEWATAAVMGFAGATLTATKTIRDRFMKDLKNSVEHKGDFERHADELSKIKFSDVKYQELGIKAFPTFVKDLLDLKRKQFKEVAEWAYKYRGVEDSWIKGTIQRFQVQSLRSRANIIFSAVIGATVGAGMTLSFFNGVATRDKIERIQDATADLKDMMAGPNPPEPSDANLRDQPHPQQHGDHHTPPKHHVTQVKDHGRVAANDPDMAIQA